MIMVPHPSAMICVIARSAAENSADAQRRRSAITKCRLLKMKWRHRYKRAAPPYRMWFAEDLYLVKRQSFSHEKLSNAPPHHPLPECGTQSFVLSIPLTGKQECAYDAQTKHDHAVIYPMLPEWPSWVVAFPAAGHQWVVVSFQTFSGKDPSWPKCLYPPPATAPMHRMIYKGKSPPNPPRRCPHKIESPVFPAVLQVVSVQNC